MWSMEPSRARAQPHCGKFGQPPAGITGRWAYTGSSPSDASRSSIHRLGRQGLEMVPGAHYVEDSEANENAVADPRGGGMKSRHDRGRETRISRPWRRAGFTGQGVRMSPRVRGRVSATCSR